MAHQQVSTLLKKQRKRSFVSKANQKKDTSLEAPGIGRTMSPYRREAAEGAHQTKCKSVPPRTIGRSHKNNDKTFVHKMNQRARRSQRTAVRHHKPHGIPVGLRDGSATATRSVSAWIHREHGGSHLKHRRFLAQDHRQGIRTSLARALRFNGFTIWAILSSLADFDAEEPKELTEKVRQYIDQLDDDSLHTDVLSYITTDNQKAKPAIDTKTTGDEASNLSTQPKRRRAKTQFEDKKNMHFETLTELKNKDCEELLVPDANSHHQEQRKDL